MHVGLVRAASAFVLLVGILVLLGGFLTLVLETIASPSSLLTVVAIFVVVIVAVVVGIASRANAGNPYW